MYIFAEPVTDDQMLELQSRNDEKIKNFERELLGLHKDKDKDNEEWDSIRAKVQESMDRDEAGEGEVEEREAAWRAEELDPEGEGKDTPEDRADENEMEAGPDDSSGLPAESTEMEAQDAEEGPVAVEERVDEDDVEADASDSASAFAEAAEADPQGNSGEGDMGKEEEAGTVPNEDAVRTSAADEAKEKPLDELKGSPDEESTDVTSTTDEGADLDSALSGAGGRPMSDALKTGRARNNNKLGLTSGDAAASAGDSRYLDALDAQASLAHDRPLLALTLTVRNKVNGKYVKRPTALARDVRAEHRTERRDLAALFGEGHVNSSDGKGGSDDVRESESAARPNRWDVEYTVEEIGKPERAWAIYRACQARRG